MVVLRKGAWASTGGAAGARTVSLLHTCNPFTETLFAIPEIRFITAFLPRLDSINSATTASARPSATRARTNGFPLKFYRLTVVGSTSLAPRNSFCTPSQSAADISGFRFAT